MEMKKINKITLAWELFKQEAPKTHIAKKVDIHWDKFKRKRLTWHFTSHKYNRKQSTLILLEP